MVSLDVLTTVVGLIGQTAVYIQVFKIFYLRSSYAISFIATFISFTSLVFWLIYGFEMKSKPLIICNIVGLVGNSLILLGIIFYGRNFW
jgi:uncharacterized protein with PQ loop repeat